MQSKPQACPYYQHLRWSPRLSNQVSFDTHCAELDPASTLACVSRGLLHTQVQALLSARPHRSLCQIVQSEQTLTHVPSRHPGRGASSCVWPASCEEPSSLTRVRLLTRTAARVPMRCCVALTSPQSPPPSCCDCEAPRTAIGPASLMPVELQGTSRCLSAACHASRARAGHAQSPICCVCALRVIGD